MREAGLWHAELVQLIISMRHGDALVIADAGLPVPQHVTVVDLAWARGQPKLIPVLAAIVAEMIVERATIAREACDKEFLAAAHAELAGIPIDHTTHDQLKATCELARAVVRTGEDTPFSNVILHAGVPFRGAQVPSDQGKR